MKSYEFIFEDEQKTDQKSSDKPHHHKKHKIEPVAPVAPVAPVKSASPTSFKKEPKSDTIPKKEPEKEIDKDDNDIKHDRKNKTPLKSSVIDDIIKVGGKIGNDLYSISDYEYNYADLKTSKKENEKYFSKKDDVAALRNERLTNIIINLSNITDLRRPILSFLDIDKDNFIYKGSIHCLIYNNKSNSFYMFYVDPLTDEYSVLIPLTEEISKKTVKQTSISISDVDIFQQRKLSEIKNLGDRYIISAKRTIESNFKKGYGVAVNDRFLLLSALGFGVGYEPSGKVSLKIEK